MASNSKKTKKKTAPNSWVVALEIDKLENFIKSENVGQKLKNSPKYRRIDYAYETLLQIEQIRGFK